jgi:small subunit ribosomal protein S4
MEGFTGKKVNYPSNVYRNKLTQFAHRLIAKQKLRIYYGVLERQIVSYVKERRASKGSSFFVLIQKIENRLDNILYRLGWARTICEARQLVAHQSILVDKRKIRAASFSCERGREIGIRNPRRRILIETNLRENTKRLPRHLSRNVQNITATVNGLIPRDAMILDFQEYYVIEYYSNRI